MNQAEINMRAISDCEMEVLKAIFKLESTTGLWFAGIEPDIIHERTKFNTKVRIHISFDIRLKGNQ